MERPAAGYDELKNASRLIIAPGQGAILVYEGKVSGDTGTAYKKIAVTGHVQNCNSSLQCLTWKKLRIIG